MRGNYQPARAWQVGEMAAVLATAGAFVAWGRLPANRVTFIVACVGLWSVYAAWRAARRPALLERWGLRLDNLGRGTARCVMVTVPAALAIVAYRLLAGYRPLPASAAVVFALYPAWALVQQFLVQGIFAGNLRRLGLPRWAVVPAAAVLFGLVHAPEWPLVGLCTAAGAAWTALFLWTPQLIPLALSHGWLGALAYYWVLERPPVPILNW